MVQQLPINSWKSSLTTSLPGALTLPNPQTTSDSMNLLICNLSLKTLHFKFLERRKGTWETETQIYIIYETKKKKKKLSAKRLLKKFCHRVFQFSTIYHPIP